MSDEEDINFIKNTSNMINSDSMSALNENASTYMGVKTIPEGTIPDKNEDYKSKKNKKNKNKNKEKNKKNKKKNKNKKNIKYDDSFSSYLSSSSYSSSSYSSSYSSSSSDSELFIEKKRNTHLNKNKKILKVEDKKKEKINNKDKNNKNNKIKNVKKEEKSKNNGKSEEKIEKTTKNEEKVEIKTNEIETKFEWDEGGNIVYLTGSFCEWKEFFPMKKNNDGKFSLILPLPRGFHQYKFKIDDIWIYSKKQPKFEDNGNVNNYIDTTDYENLNEEKKEEEKPNESINNQEEISQKEKSKEKIVEKKKEKSKNKEKEKSKNKTIKNKSSIKDKTKVNDNNKIVKQKRNSSTHNIHFLNEQKKYSIYYPLRAEFSKKPLALPGLYKTCYILTDKKNKKIKERKFSQIEYVDSTNNSIHDNEPANKSKNQSLNNSLYFINDINPYVKFQNLYHIHSNHLHSKEAININPIVTSIISRYRFKFSTFIYYKENQPIKALDKKKHSKTVRIKRGKNEKISKGTE